MAHQWRRALRQRHGVLKMAEAYIRAAAKVTNIYYIGASIGWHRAERPITIPSQHDSITP